MNQTAIRSFFACEISSTNLSAISQLLENLKAVSPKPAKWVNPDNMHLTIKFIGEFNPSDLEDMRSTLEKALSSLPSFNLEIKGMGAFPSLSKPKVVWLGINADNTLFKLVKIVNNETEKYGYVSEKRPFSAHITLGRVKPYASLEEIKTIGSVIRLNKDIVIGSQRIEDLYFFRSDLTPKGPVYQTLFKLPFSG